MRKLFIIVGVFCLAMVIITQADPNSGPYPVPGGGGGGSGGGVSTNQLVPIQFTVGINTNDASPPSSTTQFAWFTGTNNQFGAADAEPTAFSTPSAGSTNVMGIDSNNKPVLLNAGGWGAGGGGGNSIFSFMVLNANAANYAFNTGLWYVPGNLSAGGQTSENKSSALQPNGGYIIGAKFGYEASSAICTGTNLCFNFYTNHVLDPRICFTNVCSGQALNFYNVTNWIVSPPEFINGSNITWSVQTMTTTNGGVQAQNITANINEPSFYLVFSNATY